MYAWLLEGMKVGRGIFTHRRADVATQGLALGIHPLHDCQRRVGHGQVRHLLHEHRILARGRHHSRLRTPVSRRAWYHHSRSRTVEPRPERHNGTLLGDSSSSQTQQA